MLLNRLSERTARVAVIGLGYVGLPLAVAMAEAGYAVTGIDTDPMRVDQVNRGESYILDLSPSRLQGVVTSLPHGEKLGTLRATSDYSVLKTCDAVSICVPTPLNKTGDPELAHVVAATDQVAAHLHPGMVIVLESTTFPGTTTEIVLPRLAANGSGYEVGIDFFLAFSPERIDPGQPDWTVENTPKLLGGVTPACLEVALAYYGAINEQLVPVSSPEVAEMAKLLENTFRTVNIGLANEFLLMCDKLGLDAWEVIDAASTKPFGFMRFVPGPGLGGHCLPVDPHYLSWKLRALKYRARFIELASEINSEMPVYWVQKLQDRLNEAGKSIKGTHILVLGVAYKKNVGDTRESPALDIIHLLQSKGALTQYYDPHVPRIDIDLLHMRSVHDLSGALAWAECAIIAADHDEIPWQEVSAKVDLIVDTRHVL